VHLQLEDPDDMSRNPSTIQILHIPVGGSEIDITRYVVFSQSRFEAVAFAVPGSVSIVCKDPNKDLSFTTGDEIVLIIDDVRLWGGIITDKGLGHFFPVVDTTDLEAVHDLQHVLNGLDYNMWMDHRVIRDPIGDPNAKPPKAPYLDAITVGPGPLGRVMREEAIPQYMDVPPGLDYTTFVDDTNFFWAATDVKDGNGDWVTHAGDPAPLREQGTMWRIQFDEITHLGGYEWWIDASKRLHITLIELLRAPWSFVDHDPDGITKIGFREGTIREDGSQMVTDALVWGGRANQLEDAPLNQTPVFARYPDPPANYHEVREYDPEIKADIVIRMTAEQEQQAIDRQARYGLWQKAEAKFGDQNYFDQDRVDTRAYAIVAGPETGTNIVNGLDMGLNRPMWQISLTWFAHDVPGKQHLIPGQFVPMVFWTMEGEDEQGNPTGAPLALFLPLRHLNISFPTIPSDLPDEEPLTYVRFDGEFGIAYSDSRYMWRYLRKGTNEQQQRIIATTGQSSTSTKNGALGGTFPQEAPDGSRTEFTLPFSYLAGSIQVYINALLQRPRVEYVESSPTQGIFTFAQAPFADDTIWVVYRTGAS
jgi:hypothetical protein